LTESSSAPSSEYRHWHAYQVTRIIWTSWAPGDPRECWLAEAGFRFQLKLKQSRLLQQFAGQPLSQSTPLSTSLRHLPLTCLFSTRHDDIDGSYARISLPAFSLGVWPSPDHFSTLAAVLPTCPAPHPSHYSLCSLALLLQPRAACFFALLTQLTFPSSKSTGHTKPASFSLPLSPRFRLIDL
jgi:hypothetical protein